MIEPLSEPETVALPLPRSMPTLLRTILLLVGALAVCTWALVSGWLPAVVSTDLDQQRLDVALPPAAAQTTFSQTFIPQHNGLSEIEILVARSAPHTEQPGALTLQLLDDSGTPVAGQSWSTNRLEHNRSLVLRFEPQANSRGRTYTLLLRGEGANPYSAWAYSLDVYEGGVLSGGGDAARDLRFTTRYRLGFAGGLHSLAGMLADGGAILLLAVAVLFLPGSLLLLLAAPRLPALDKGAWAALALVLGVAIWPFLWFWPSLLGVGWTRPALALLLGGGWALVAAVLLLRRRGPARRERAEQAKAPLRRVLTWHAAHLLLALLLLIAMAVRLLAVRDLAFPPWVDSSRHALITAVMVESGRAITDYGPYLPVQRFPYHFGFHALPATMTLLAEWPLRSTLLFLGQLLNALAPLTIYGAVWMLTRRRPAALLGAFLVALPFFFPAYYATWGRFTQLAGVLILPPLLALTWLAARGARGWRATWWLTGLLAAGLALIHFRVFLVYLPFAALAWLLAPGRRRLWLALAGLWGLFLAAPRLLQLANQATESGLFQAAGEAYAQFPGGYLTVGWERAFLILGGVAFLVAVVAALRRRRWALLPVTLGGWVGLVALLLSGRLPRLPATWLINLNSAYILLFVPLALLLALLFARVWRLARLHGALVSAPAALLLGGALAAALLFGARQQIDILNQTTILALPADVPGLQWIDQNLPSDARLAVNSWQWLGLAWAGSDGGAWLLPLTGRTSSTPPVDYTYDRQLFQQVSQFNREAMAVEEWSDPAAVQWLLDEGMTHVYVGARGGFLDPAALARNPRVDTLYAHDGVFVFALR